MKAAKAQAEGSSKDLILFDEELDLKGEKDTPLTRTTLAAMMLQLDEKERDAYIRYMQMQGEDLGFQEAWMWLLSFEPWIGTPCI